MKNTNPKRKGVRLSKDYVKGFLLNGAGKKSLEDILKASDEVYMLNTEDYDDNTGSVTVTIHFKD